MTHHKSGLLGFNVFALLLSLRNLLLQKVLLAVMLTLHFLKSAFTVGLTGLKFIGESLVLNSKFIELLLKTSLLRDSGPSTKFNLFVENLLLFLKFGDLSLCLLVILLILIDSLTHLFLIFCLDLHELALMLVGILVLLVIALLLIGLNVVLEHAMSILEVSLQLLFLLFLEVMLA